MTYSFPLTLCLLFTLAAGTSFADPLSDPDVDNFLKELETIEQSYNSNRVSLRTNAVRAFEAAAASDKAAYEFYLQCYKTLEFDAKDASFSDFRAWREKKEGEIKTESNLMAMRLQLQYLVLTMKAAEGVKRETIIPDLEAFITNIVQHTEDLGRPGMKILRESVKNTIFAKAYKLDKSLEVTNWCFEPGNFGAVYDQSIFPFFREESGEQLGAVWDRRIAMEIAFIQAFHEDNEYELNKFETERLPQLYWQKAVDIYQNHSEQEGAQAMMLLLKNNPYHTSLKSWIEQFRSFLGSRDTESGDGLSSD